MQIYPIIAVFLNVACIPNIVIADHSLGYVRPAQKEIKVLSEPSRDSIIGTLSLVVEKSSGYSNYKFALNKFSEEVSISSDMYGTGYKLEEAFYPLYYEVNGSFVKLFSHSSPGYWIEIKQGDELVTPTKELTQYAEYQVSGYDSYRLRRQSNITSEIIVTLSELKHIIKGWTGRVNGSWAEAIIVELGMDDLNFVKGCGYIKKEMQLLNQYQGCIKVANDKGKLHDISFVTSC